MATYRAVFGNMYFSMATRKEKTGMKLVVNTKDNERVLGVHIIGRGADEMLQGFGECVSVCVRERESE